jgi:ABC-type sugar transport system ATPase subunit
VRTAAARDKLTELVVGIRPEHLHLVAAGRRFGGGSRRRQGGGSGGGRRPVQRELAGEILLVEELGADALMHVRLAGEDGGAVPAVPVDGTVVARTEGRKSAGSRAAGLVPRPAGRRLRVHPETGARLAG